MRRNHACLLAVIHLCSGICKSMHAACQGINYPHSTESLMVLDIGEPSVMSPTQALMSSYWSDLDVLVTVPLGILVLIRRLKLCQIHRVSQQSPNASKPSAELASFLQVQQHLLRDWSSVQRAGCSFSCLGLHDLT